MPFLEVLMLAFQYFIYKNQPLSSLQVKCSSPSSLQTRYCSLWWLPGSEAEEQKSLRSRETRVVLQPSSLKSSEILGGSIKILRRFYLFNFRQRGREGERHQCVVASHAPPTGDPGPQPTYVSWLGIELVTLLFTGQHSTYWAISASTVQWTVKKFY